MAGRRGSSIALALLASLELITVVTGQYPYPPPAVSYPPVPPSCNTDCPDDDNPVCASDLNTYRNMCKMRAHACRWGIANLEALDKGPCGNCTIDKWSCRCPNDNSTIAKFKCKNHYSTPEFVCGSDDVSYENICHLNLANLCTPSKTITKKYDGECIRPVCSVWCPPDNYPVCGSDRITYPNECWLGIAKSCTHGQEDLVKLHDGECDCANDDSCLEVGKSLPVCGSNGKTYKNKCELYVEKNCKKQNVSVAHQGVCRCGANYRCTKQADEKPSPVCGSDGVTYDNECFFNLSRLCTPKLNVSSLGRCKCIGTCPAIYQPVCGSNFKTYSSDCVLKAENCKRNLNLFVRHTGECECGRSYPCTKEYRPVCGNDGVTYSNICLFNISRICIPTLLVDYYGECGCNDRCPEYYSPVCGSDIETYSNICFFNASNCCSGSALTIFHLGECQCGNYYPCTKENEPICGTDRVTYPNKCLFKVAKLCNPGLKVAFGGTCDCDQPCYKIYDPVCGSDFKTYGNLCVFNVAKCKSDLQLSLLHEGECECANNYPCTFEFRPVCGTNGVQYDNECLLKLANLCTPGVEITVDRFGRCPDGCDLNCPFILSPVCGTDLKTYSNDCLLKQAICKSGGTIQRLHRGKCQCPWRLVCINDNRPVCSNKGIDFMNECFLNRYRLCSDSRTVKKHSGYCKGGSPTAFQPTKWTWIVMMSLAIWWMVN